jgi:Oxidoreductase-like protein, N-terminal
MNDTNEYELIYILLQQHLHHKMLTDDENAEPIEPNTEDCCGQGCSSCVWDTYRENLKKYQAKQEDQMQSSECGLSKLEFQPCSLVDIRVLTEDTSVYRSVDDLLKIIVKYIIHINMKLNIMLPLLLGYNPKGPYKFFPVNI